MAAHLDSGLADACSDATSPPSCPHLGLQRRRNCRRGGGAAGAIAGNLPDALIGQGELTVSPLQMALALAALANEGALPAPRLVTAVQSETGEWQSVPVDGEGREAASAAAASQILRSLSQHDATIVEFATQALAGPGGSSNAWYLGLAPAQEPRFAVVVVMEGASGTTGAASTGRALLNAALTESD